MSEIELKTKSDNAWKSFENALKGLDMEERMKTKWRALAEVSTQKKIALAKQNARF